MKNKEKSAYNALNKPEKIRGGGTEMPVFFAPAQGAGTEADFEANDGNCFYGFLTGRRLNESDPYISFVMNREAVEIAADSSLYYIFLAIVRDEAGECHPLSSLEYDDVSVDPVSGEIAVYGVAGDTATMCYAFTVGEV